MEFLSVQKVLGFCQRWSKANVCAYVYFICIIFKFFFISVYFFNPKRTKKWLVVGRVLYKTKIETNAWLFEATQQKTSKVWSVRFSFRHHAFRFVKFVLVFFKLIFCLVSNSETTGFIGFSYSTIWTIKQKQTNKNKKLIQCHIHTCSSSWLDTCSSTFAWCCCTEPWHCLWGRGYSSSPYCKFLHIW